jgi:hypothetical protein
MTKKIRLLDEEATESTETGTTATAASAEPKTSGTMDSQTIEQFMKYAEAIDWKLWEILKLLRSKIDD